MRSVFHLTKVSLTFKLTRENTEEALFNSIGGIIYLSSIDLLPHMLIVLGNMNQRTRVFYLDYVQNLFVCSL